MGGKYVRKNGHIDDPLNKYGVKEARPPDVGKRPYDAGRGGFVDRDVGVNAVICV